MPPVHLYPPLPSQHSVMFHAMSNCQLLLVAMATMFVVDESCMAQHTSEGLCGMVGLLQIWQTSKMAEDAASETCLQIRINPHTFINHSIITQNKWYFHVNITQGPPMLSTGYDFPIFVYCSPHIGCLYSL